MDDADISRNVLSLDWTSGVKYLDGTQKPTDDKQKEFKIFFKITMEMQQF